VHLQCQTRHELLNPFTAHEDQNGQIAFVSAPRFGALSQWQAVVHNVELRQHLPLHLLLKRGVHVNSLHRS